MDRHSLGVERGDNYEGSAKEVLRIVILTECDTISLPENLYLRFFKNKFELQGLRDPILVCHDVRDLARKALLLIPRKWMAAGWPSKNIARS